MVDRSALDRIIAAGGYITANTGNAPDGNAIPIGKEILNDAMDSAACIACGACGCASAKMRVRPFSRVPKSLTLRCCRRAIPSAVNA
jgi:hypothetical protein